MDNPTLRPAQFVALHEARRGDRRWSEHFGCYVVLVSYVDDDRWTFTPESGEAAGQVLNAQTKWSTMPLVRPIPVSRR